MKTVLCSTVPVQITHKSYSTVCDGVPKISSLIVLTFNPQSADLYISSLKVNDLVVYGQVGVMYRPAETPCTL